MRTFKKPPVWLRIMSAVVAVPFFLLTPNALLVAVMLLTGNTPGGYAGPTSFHAKIIGVCYLLFPIFGLSLLWVALGTPGVRHSNDCS